jgi:hypothetical protein
MSLIKFANDKQLIDFAIDFLVKDRLKSLNYDVDRCLKPDNNNSNSPLPALLYCLAMIDLLGALFKGNAKGRATTQNSKDYMVTFMKYSTDEAELLQQVYRHKTVHLSAPMISIIHKGKTISWKLHDTSRADHLSINSEKGDIDLFGCGSIHYDGKFIVDIPTLKDDIQQSVEKKPDGYLAMLENDSSLKLNFKEAINEIYKPIII